MNDVSTCVSNLLASINETKAFFINKENKILEKDKQISLLFLMSIQNSDESSSTFLPKDVVFEILKTKTELHSKDAALRAEGNKEIWDELNLREEQYEHFKDSVDFLMEMGHTGLESLYDSDEEETQNI